MSKYILNNDWTSLLQNEFNKTYYLELSSFLNKEYLNHTIYPKSGNTFEALNATPFSSVKVVILGQDPYHGANQAHGLSFSVEHNIKKPPSLLNIFKELQDDVGCAVKNDGNLTGWAKQGVLLLNTVLTVRAGQAHSHKNKGWEQFTDEIIHLLNQKEQPIVYILWGATAQKKREIINTNKHHIVKSPHPSPLSAYRGFFKSKPFSKANELLKKDEQVAIKWCQF